MSYLSDKCLRHLYFTIAFRGFVPAWSSIQNVPTVHVLEIVCGRLKLVSCTIQVTWLHWYILGYWPGTKSLKWMKFALAIVKSSLLKAIFLCGMNKITVDLPPARFCSDSAFRRASLLLRSSCSSTRGMSKPPSPIKSLVDNKAPIANVRWYAFVTW